MTEPAVIVEKPRQRVWILPRKRHVCPATCVAVTHRRRTGGLPAARARCRCSRVLSYPAGKRPGLRVRSLASLPHAPLLGTTAMPPFRLSAIATFCGCCFIAAAALLIREHSTRAWRSEVMRAPPQASPIASVMYLNSVRNSSELHQRNVVAASPSSEALGSQSARIGR